MTLSIELPQVVSLAQALGKPICGYDLETTTFRGRSNFAIMEVFALVVRPDAPHLKSFGGLVDPERAVDLTVQELTGVRPAMLKGQPTWGERYASLFQKAAAGNCWLAGYNNKTFDNHALKDMGERYGLPIAEIALSFDVRQLYLGLSAKKDRSGKLGEVAQELGVARPSQLHRAQADVVLTMLILERLLDLYGQPAVCALVLPKPPKAKDRLSAAALARYCKQKRGVTVQGLAQAFKQPERLVSFEMAKALDERLVDPDVLRDPQAQGWLQQALEQATPSLLTAGMRLKPLFEQLSLQKPPASVDYLQLRVALMQRGVRWASLKP